MLPPGFLSGLSYTVLSREETGFGSHDAGPPPFHTWSLTGAWLNPSTCCRALDTICFLLSRNSRSPSERSKSSRRSRSPELPWWDGVGWVLDDCSVEENLDQAYPHSMGPLRKGPDTLPSPLPALLCGAGRRATTLPASPRTFLTSFLPSPSAAPPGPERDNICP